MDVAVTGSHGLIGSALIEALRSGGHRVLRLVREDPLGPDAVRWDPLTSAIDSEKLEGLDAVVHLAGAGIGDKKWTPARKQLVLESRSRGTKLLARALAGLTDKPGVLVSGSAIGYYGDRGDEVLTEESAPGDDFGADVCREWEAATAPAADAGIRVVRIRTGLVQAGSGGMLHRLLLPFKLGAGGRLGSGKQYMSWIALDDEVSAIRHIIATPSLEGPVNLTAPNPVTNADYTETLGRVLHRPAVIPTPLFGLKAVYGAELVETLLGSQRVSSEKLQGSGFEFAYPELEAALRAANPDRERTDPATGVRLWIDTDVGDNPDDAIALVVAGAHPDVELVGVSTTGGRTAWRARLAAELVDAPVVAGERPDDLVEAFRQAAPDALLAIGSLTNVAEFVALGVRLPATTVMGGALAPVRHRGRLLAAEHNFAADPSAAAVVVARTDALIVPLDVTAALRLTDDQVDELVRRDARLLPEVARWRAQYDDPVVVHDPLALLACVGDPLVTTARVRLRVDARDGTLRASDEEEGREHAVVVAVDASAAVDRVLGLMG